MKKKRSYTIKIIHPPERGVALEEIRELERPLTLEENQAIVGGLIEVVQVMYQGKQCDLICNEEGIYLDGRMNPIATRYYRDFYRGKPEYDQTEVEGLGIVGVAILMVDHYLK